MEFNIKALDELIKRDYRVPLFLDPMPFAEEISLHNVENNNVSIKDLVLPILKDYDITKKREAFLISTVEYLLKNANFHFQSEPEKQNLVDEIKQAIPDYIWPTFYRGKK